MRAVVQRVRKASVTVSGEKISEIDRGLLVFIGFSQEDSGKDSDYIIGKVDSLRIFPDENDVMNLSIGEYGGEVLLVSQFTLYGDARKGRRPSYSRSMKPSFAEPFYKNFIELFKNKTGLKTKTGVFGADMDVEILNWGPITILLDSEKNF